MRSERLPSTSDGIVRLVAAAVAAVLVIVVSPAGAQPAARDAATDEPKAAGTPGTPSSAAPAIEPARDLHEETVWIDATAADLYGRRETRRIPVTVFEPAGPGPFPLLVMNHGRAPAERRAQQGRQRYEPLARYFVAKGFVVMLPTRIGYADTYGDFDPESTGNCASARLEPQAEAASDQVLATLAYARTRTDVDTSRWIVAGQSVGGVATLATAWRHPPGLVGAINFAGGTGGDPERNPGRPCQPDRIARFWSGKAAEASVPTLWLYWQNDLYWGPENPKRWADAWRAGGGQVEFHTLDAAGKDGHGGVNFDMDHWVPWVEPYLAGLGFTRPGTVSRPAASGHAQVDQLDKVPVTPGQRDTSYRRFLEAKSPRAYAVGANGATGWATGDWAAGRALGFCARRRGEACRLYAVDDDVVWSP